MLLDRDFLVVQAATRRTRVISQKTKSTLVVELALFLTALTGLVFLFVAVIYVVYDLKQKRFFYLYIGLFLVLEGIVVVISFWPKACQVIRPKRSESQRLAMQHSGESVEDLIEDMESEPFSQQLPHPAKSAPHIMEWYGSQGN